MYYFRYADENHLSIHIKASEFDNTIDGKLKISMSPKIGVDIYAYDIDGELIAIKKNSLLKQDISNALLNSQWHRFITEEYEIEGFANEDGELIEPYFVFNSIKRDKKQSFSRWTNILSNFNLPPILDEEILLKKKATPYIHIYYRHEFQIFHVCLDELEDTLVSLEVFNKINV